MAKDVFIQCSCGTDGIVIGDFDDGEGYLSIWSYGKRGTCWRYRLIHIWHILTRGYPHEDSFCIDHTNIDEVVNALMGLKKQIKVNQ